MCTLLNVSFCPSFSTWTQVGGFSRIKLIAPTEKERSIPSAANNSIEGLWRAFMEYKPPSYSQE